MLRAYKVSDPTDYTDFQEYLFSQNLVTAFDWSGDFFTINSINYTLSTMHEVGGDALTSDDIEDWGIANYITNATVIATITNEANWDGDGNYTGAYSGLVSNNIYFDTNTGLRYEYNGADLIRANFNEAI